MAVMQKKLGEGLTPPASSPGLFLGIRRAGGKLLARPRALWTKCRRKLKVTFGIHPSIRRYIKFSRETWLANFSCQPNSVVLVGLYSVPCSVHSYGYVLNYLARKTNSRIEWFSFTKRREYLLEKIFTALGCHPGLYMSEKTADLAAARSFSAELFDGLKSKWDVVNLSLEGVIIGDLIYDTYLRVSYKPTVDIKDKLLQEIIRQAILIFRAIRSYLASRRVVAVIADHTYYIYSGIMVRLACLAGIPVHQVVYGLNFYTVPVSPDPAGSQVALRWPFPDFRILFNKLSTAEQAAAREKGLTSLESRLAGIPNISVLALGTAYCAPSVERILKDSGRPRILILLNDFFDAVHLFRGMLFPDFYEWVHYLIERASQTPFDWYVKPHPNILFWEHRGEPAQAAANRGVVAELRSRFPAIHFLDPTVSNRQIISEGINAMFTVHGTAGHEFAYYGVPVVNAGDNQHIAYSFNLHPQNLADYDRYIANAGELQVECRKEDIAEFVYMNFFYFQERFRSDVNPMPESFFETDEYLESRSRPETYDYMRHTLTPAENQKLAAYFDRQLRSWDELAAIGHKSKAETSRAATSIPLSRTDMSEREVTRRPR
jgi:hypothetical protein